MTMMLARNVTGRDPESLRAREHDRKARRRRRCGQELGRLRAGAGRALAMRVRVRGEAGIARARIVAAYDRQRGPIRRHGAVADHKAGEQELHADRETGERGAEKAPGRNDWKRSGAPSHLDLDGPRELELRATTL